jgi:hypothetical protein
MRDARAPVPPSSIGFESKDIQYHWHGYHCVIICKAYTRQALNYIESAWNGTWSICEIKSAWNPFGTLRLTTVFALPMGLIYFFT